MKNWRNRTSKSKRNWYKQFFLAIAIVFLLVVATIPIRIAIAYYQSPQPQAILTLGGGDSREKFTAKFAQKHPSLEIWVSSGIRPTEAQKIFHAAGISEQKVHLDYRAADTVTNFTSLVREFKARHIKHLYLITSDYHMPRARAIATIVLGSRGIAFTPVSIPENKPKESSLHILRDTGRAVLWVFTGRTGASLNPEYHSRLH